MTMKRVLGTILLLFTIAISASAQEEYVMGYETATIKVVDQSFFQTLTFPGMPGVCGFFDRNSGNFYSCDYSTYRNVEEDFINADKADNCCESIDFDARKYYGSVTFQGVIDTVEWDNLVLHLITDKARIRIKTDEKEIDALYKALYKDNRIMGKRRVILTLVTYDTVVENGMDFRKKNKSTKKPQRKFVKFLRF